MRELEVYQLTITSKIKFFVAVVQGQLNQSYRISLLTNI